MLMICSLHYHCERRWGCLRPQKLVHWGEIFPNRAPERFSPRALLCDPTLSAARRRLDKVCAPGYTGRKRGEVARTRTTALQCILANRLVPMQTEAMVTVVANWPQPYWPLRPM